MDDSGEDAWHSLGETSSFNYVSGIRTRSHTPILSLEISESQFAMRSLVFIAM
jgi:hypothetical protein